MRRLAALSVLLSCAVMPPAFAGPTATGAEDGADVDVVLTDAAGQRHVLRILATLPTQASTATAPTLRVHILESGTKRSGDLSATAFTMRGGTATLSASLAGAALRVVWQAKESTLAASWGEAGTDLESDGWTVIGKGGTAQVTFGAMRCTTEAVVIGSVVAHDTDGYGGPLTQSLGLNLAGARCSSPASSDYAPVP